MDQALHDLFRVDGWLHDVASGLTRLGGTEVLVAVAAASVYLLRRAGLGWWGSCGPAGSLWICAVLTSFLKDVVDRTRPEAGVDLSSASFPSGHASNTTALVLALALAVPLVSTGVSRRRGLTIALLVAFTMGWTRVALGVHWATDVLAGWVLGAVVALVVMRNVIAREQRWTPVEPDRV